MRSGCLLCEYLTATIISVVVEHGASSHPPSCKKLWLTSKSFKPRKRSNGCMDCDALSETSDPACELRRWLARSLRMASFMTTTVIGNGYLPLRPSCSCSCSASATGMPKRLRKFELMDQY